MVKSPVVYLAGMLRTTGQGIERDDWAWELETMGQYPYQPPSVAGWEWGPAWLSTNAMRARFVCANTVLDTPAVAVPEDAVGDPTLAPEDALAAAHAAAGAPWMSSDTRAVLVDLARNYFDDLTERWEQKEKPRRAAMLQRTLRQLLLSGPDAHLH
jgi:uncharacterized protein (DUF1800 family)